MLDSRGTQSAEGPTGILLEPVEGFEPPTSCLQNNRSTPELHRRDYLGYRNFGDLLGWGYVDAGIY